MRSQEARDYIQSLKHLDPQVVRKADSIYCQLTGDPDITAEPDGSIRLVWKHWADETIKIDVKVSKEKG
jgi:hypothetical protein